MVVSLAALTFLAACGDDGGEEASSTVEPQAASSTAPHTGGQADDSASTTNGTADDGDGEVPATSDGASSTTAADATATDATAANTTVAGSASSDPGSGFPVTIDTTFGPVTVEEEPQRIVATGWGDAETALALGIQPVGASDWLEFGGDGVGPWAEGLYEESPEMVGTLEPSLEQIAALRPDLIIDVKSSGEQTRYDALSQIAPTIGPPEGAEAYVVSWQEQVRTIAAATGRSERGDELIREVDEQFQEAADAHPEFDGATISVGAYTGDEFAAYVRGDGRVDFVEELGFVNNPDVQELAGERFSVSLPHEQLGTLDADLVVMVPIGVEASEITDDPVFQSIPAVNDGRVVVFDDPTLSNAFSTNTVLSLQYALDEVVPVFADALDGA